MNPTNKSSTLILGLMSGTSADGLDIALCDIQNATTIQLVESASYQYPTKTKAAIRLAQTKNSFNDDGLVADVTQLVIDSLQDFISTRISEPSTITAIANHGQTILHQPKTQNPFSLQIGDAQLITNSINIPVIADFRTADIEAGGEGAPLIPAFHHAVFQQHAPCYIVNIGGISNISFVSNDAESVTGFDTGPGNTLMDQWIKQHQNKDYDHDGSWARSGELIPELLNDLLDEPYFSAKAPKSTGQNLFNLSWLNKFLNTDMQADNVQRTLLELTAVSICDAINDSNKLDEPIFLCGGGALNSFLVERIQALSPNSEVSLTSKLGIHPQWVEAMGFAWLGYCRLNQITSNLPAVTGAKKKVCLGKPFYPTPMPTA